METVDFLLILAVGGACGLLGRLTSRQSAGGTILYIGAGVFGAFAGMWAVELLNLPEVVPVRTGPKTSFPLIWSLIGSAFFVAAIGLFVKPGR